MGFFSSIANAAASAVGKVAEVATGGAIGKMIAGALERFGLPKEICGIIACLGDPSYTTKFLTEEIDRVGKALGLPEQLTGALKKIVQNAEKYAQAFAKGGFGAVVAEVGKDLGLPPELYLAVAAAVDAYTGNAAGAAANLMKLAGQCAKHLGIPESAINIVEFAGAAYSGDVKGMTEAGMEIGMDVVDSLDVVPEEFKTMMHAGVESYLGNDQAAQEHILKLAGQVAERIGVPPEAMGLLDVAVAYAQDDDKAMEAALKKIGNDLVGRLPPEYQGPLRQAVELFAKDPEKALEAIKNFPETAKEGFKLLTAAAKNPENLKKAAELGIKELPPELQGPVRKAVDAYIEDPKAAKASLQTMPARAKEEFFKLLDKATDTENLKKVAKEQLEKAVAGMSPQTRRAYDLSLHLATGDTKALKEDLDKFTADERKKLPPSAQEALRLVGQIADGDTAALKQEIDKVKNQAIQEMTDRYQLPIRA